MALNGKRPLSSEIVEWDGWRRMIKSFITRTRAVRPTDQSVSQSSVVASASLLLRNDRD